MERKSSNEYSVVFLMESVKFKLRNLPSRTSPLFLQGGEHVLFIVADSQMRFGTNYNDTLNLLYLELLRLSVKFGKR